MRRHPSQFSGASSRLLGATVVLVAAVATLGFASAAHAGAARAEEPTPTPGADAGAATNVGPATAGAPLCTVGSAALIQISGMVATDKGILVVQAGDDTNVKIHTLDGTCKTTVKTYTTANPLDPQDLAVSADGTIWVGDTGDKEGARATIAIHKIAPGAGAAIPHRMTYPDGAKTAAAFLLGPEDVPIILASVAGKPGVTLYRPTKALVANATANLPALEKVGEFVPATTGTSNPSGPVGQSTVTGAAKSPDGKKVVIRTLSDAYEWDVPDGDVVKAITAGKARITPLPDEPAGEAISYTTDNAKFITASFKVAGAAENVKILSYTPFVPPPAAPDGGEDPNAGDNQPTGDGQSWFERLSFSELTRIVAAVGVVGLVLAIAGIIGIRRARKRRREEDDEYDDYEDEYDEPPQRGRGGGRGRQDESGYGVRDPQYGDGYDQYGGGGYAEAGYGAANGYAGQQGYGANGGYGPEYADAGYGQQGGQQGAGGYPANGHAAANGYGQQQYADQYGQQQQPYADPYAAPPAAQQQQGAYDGYAQQQYGGDQYADQQYAADQYGGQQYGGQQYGGQQYGDYGAQPGTQPGAQGQQYPPGYDEFDPMQDPRRR